MQYKTIILELLQQRTELHDRLCKERMLLATMEHYALELKSSHEAWKERLIQAKPGSDPNQALEMVLAEMEDRLPAESPQNDALSLDEAMAYLRRHSPRA